MITFRLLFHKLPVANLLCLIFICFFQLRDAVGQRFSSGWSSAGSYKSSKSVRSNKSDKLVKKMIKRDQKMTKMGAINKGYVVKGSHDSKDQVLYFTLY